MKRVIVIGAGVAGLAAAARLQHAGYEVTLFEKEPLVGGKMNQIREEGFTFDVGPTIVMMPELYREVFETCGRNATTTSPWRRSNRSWTSPSAPATVCAYRTISPL